MSTVLQNLVNQPYRHGFVTDIESDVAPKGLNEDTIRLISTQEERARSGCSSSASRLIGTGSRWTEPTWPNVHYPKIDFQAISYYSAPKPKPKLAQHGRGRSRAAAHLREARRADERAGGAGRRRGRRDLRQRVGGHHLQGEARRGRHHLLLDLRSRARSIPSWCASTSARWCRSATTIYAALNSAVFTDGSFCFIPKGVKCPMDLSTYFRINTQESGQFERTLIVAEEGAIGLVSRRLHRAQVRHQPAACGGGRAGGARPCRHQVLDGAELVRGR